MRIRERNVVWTGRAAETPREEGKRVFGGLLAAAFVTYMGLMVVMESPGWLKGRRAVSSLKGRLEETMEGSAFTVKRRGVCVADCRNPDSEFNFNHALVADFSKGNHFEEYIYDLELRLLEAGVGNMRERWFNRCNPDGKTTAVVKVTNVGSGWLIDEIHRGDDAPKHWESAVQRFGLSEGSDKLIYSGAGF